MISRVAAFAALLLVACQAPAHDPETGQATSIVNEGVMVEAGGTKILFDPVFEPGIYAHMDEALAAKIIAGEAPYDGVDAVFVSHAHSDHFTADQMIAMMTAQPALRLYAPAQAVDMMRDSERWDDALAARIEAVAPAEGQALRYTLGDTRIDAVRVPHAGYPDRNADVQNIVFRVALAPDQRVMHLGDADGRLAQFAPYADHFAEARTGLAFVPFWMMLEEDGRAVIDETLNTEQSIGIHLGPRGHPDLAEDDDHFTRPGEVRAVPSTHRH